MISVKKRFLIIMICCGLASFSQPINASPLEEIVKKYTSKLYGKSEYAKLNIPKLCFDDEKTIMQIEAGLLVNLKNEVLHVSQPGKESLNLKALNKFGPKNQSIKTFNEIFESTWQVSDKNRLDERLAAFKKIEFTEIKIEDYKIDETDRDAAHNFTKAALKLKFDIRAKAGDGSRIHDVFRVSVAVALNDGRWIINSAELLSGKTLTAKRKSVFADVSVESEVDRIQFENRKYLRHGGHVSAVDLNRDGYVDIIFHDKLKKQIFLYDLQGKKFTKYNGEPDAFNNQASTAKNITAENDWSNAVLKLSELTDSVAFAADFDANNKIDYLDENFFSKSKNSFAEQVVSFSDFKKPEANKSKEFKVIFDSSLSLQSALPMDVNRDAKIDAIAIDQRGTLANLFKNKGSGQMLIEEERAAVVSYNYAWQINSADINRDGYVDVGVTDVNFSEFNRINTACMRHHAVSIFGMDNRGFKVYLNKDGKWSDNVNSDLEDTGEAIASASFLDYNNDGLIDIYMANGLWSGDEQGQQVAPFFVAVKRGGREPVSEIIGKENSLGFYEFLKSFNSRLLNFVGLAEKQNPPAAPSLAGFQRNRLFRNNGDGSFTDVAYMEGVDSQADGFSVITLDYNKDGAIDLLLRNANPINENNKVSTVQLFKNENLFNEKAVVFEFDESSLIKAASGLIVRAHAPDGLREYSFSGLTNFSNSQKLIHFGLGKNAALPKVEIFWHDGTKKTLRNIKPGVYKLH